MTFKEGSCLRLRVLGSGATWREGERGGVETCRALVLGTLQLLPALHAVGVMAWSCEGGRNMVSIKESPLEVKSANRPWLLRVIVSSKGLFPRLTEKLWLLSVFWRILLLFPRLEDLRIFLQRRSRIPVFDFIIACLFLIAIKDLFSL